MSIRDCLIREWVIPLIGAILGAVVVSILSKIFAGDWLELFTHITLTIWIIIVLTISFVVILLSAFKRIRFLRQRLASQETGQVGLDNTSKLTNAHNRLVTLCLRHRIHAREDYYERAFESGDDVLYISIMSQATLKEMNRYLEKARASNTRLRVMTWNPYIGKDVAEALRKHLNEPGDIIPQIQQAAEGWQKFAEKYSGIDLRLYESMPTLQAVFVGSKWAVVEIMPYAAHPSDRPALILNSSDNPQVLRQFKDAFEKLWVDNKHD
jgi:hypothetical protein